MPRWVNVAIASLLVGTAVTADGGTPAHAQAPLPRIVYDRPDPNLPGTEQLVLVNPDGTGTTLLSPATLVDPSIPDWSRDGKLLAVRAFSTVPGRQQDIFTYDPVGGGVYDVTNLQVPPTSCGIGTKPLVPEGEAFSSDGQHIAYTVYEICTNPITMTQLKVWELLVNGVSSGLQEAIVGGGTIQGFDGVGVDWSPTQNLVVLPVSTLDPKSLAPVTALFVGPPTASSFPGSYTQITFPAGNLAYTVTDLFPAISADGQHVAFVRYVTNVFTNASTVFLMTADMAGGNERVLQTFQNEIITHVSWSSDGARLVFDRGGLTPVVSAQGARSRSMPPTLPSQLPNQGSNGLWLVGVDGCGLVPLVPGPAWTPAWAPAPLVASPLPPPCTVVSTQQYTLRDSNGTTWTDVDPTKLSLTLRPTLNAQAILTANADLWTANAGFNQDLAITVNGNVVAWKESGGFAGTFSPNAAFVQTIVHMSAGTTYIVKLQWKTNKAAPGTTIFAGAGPIGTQFSPTRLTAQLVPDPTPFLATAVSTKQYHLLGSDGSTWRALDPIGLSLNYTPAVSGVAILGGNADLWTANAGFNQDLAITVNGAVVAWKESGGFAGTFSPNAAFVLATVAMTAFTPYVVKLQWKTNKQASVATIYAGAGPIGTEFSPTRLTLGFIPFGTGLTDQSSPLQYNLFGSDGSTWMDMDATTLKLTLTPPVNVSAIVGGNADLWTANAGFNQDLGIDVNGAIVAWKESGGFAGTFSPNAAMVQTVVNMLAGKTYTIKLRWKTNKAASGATIYAGAGPIGTKFSPTRLTVLLVPA